MFTNPSERSSTIDWLDNIPLGLAIEETPVHARTRPSKKEHWCHSGDRTRYHLAMAQQHGDTVDATSTTSSNVRSRKSRRIDTQTTPSARASSLSIRQAITTFEQASPSIKLRQLGKEIDPPAIVIQLLERLREGLGHNNIPHGLQVSPPNQGCVSFVASSPRFRFL
jgi:hypothetical protein